MKKTSELISYYTNVINSFELDESVLFLFLEKLTGLSRMDVLLNATIDVDEVVLSEMVESYCNGVSAQYLTNFQYFLGRKFYVNENVLIPRFETEEVVLSAIEIIKENNFTKVCDIGTGSGVIAISVSLECGINVDAVDISSDALDVAKKNCQSLNADVSFYEGNMLDPLLKNDYEVIISNPPYIPKDGYVAKETFENEPHLALFGGSDGMVFYREIVEKSRKFKNLKYIIFEIGYDQEELIKNLSLDNVEVRNDINGNPRIAIIKI